MIGNSLVLVIFNQINVEITTAAISSPIGMHSVQHKE